jgi:hypothetical protein
MSFKRPEMMNKVVDCVQEHVEFTKAARAAGISEPTLWRWLADSRRAKKENFGQPSPFLFERDGETDYLHEFIKRCIRENIEAIESGARSRAMNGTWVPATYRGETIWKKDPFLVGRPDLIDLLGVPDDLFRDENGMPQPEVTWQPPSTDLVAMVLAAHSRKYRKQSKLDVDINMRAAVAGGVMVVGTQQRQVAAPLPEVEYLPTEAQPVEAVGIDDIVGPEPAPPLEEEQLLGGDETAPVADVTPAQPGPNPAVKRTGLSALEQSLLTELNARPRPAPAAPVTNYVSEDDDLRRTGRGPKPTGFKVA